MALVGVNNSSLLADTEGQQLLGTILCPLGSTGTAHNQTCMVKRSLNQFSDRCFATAGPTLWNSLPEQLRQPDISFGQFK